MLQTREPLQSQSGGFGTDRAAIVFVSASVEDARALWEFLDADRWLVVNVPDLIGARAVIDKLHPQLVLCDTEIEGRGSWRDLLDEPLADFSFELVVVSRHLDESLWTEVLTLGAANLLEKPLVAEQFAHSPFAGKPRGTTLTRIR